MIDIKNQTNYISTMKATLFSVFLLLLMTLYSCSSNDNSIYIASEIHEIDFVSSIYQNAFPDRNIIIKIVPVISQALVESGKYDLLIGKSLSDSKRKATLVNLEAMSNSGLPDELARNWYLMNAGKWEGSQHLVPLCYDLPIIIYKNDPEKTIESIVSFDIFREYCSSFNTRDNHGEWNQMGFSPGWNPEILIWEMLCRNISLESDGNFQLTEDDTLELVENTRNWQLQVSQSREKEDNFSEKYRYIPDFKLLEQGKIGYLPMPYSEYLHLSDSMRNSLDFFFPGNKRIPMISVVSCGIPKDSKNQDAAWHFLSWLLKKENQTAIVEHFQQNKLDSFGFLGGFSSLDSLNRSTLSEYYPELKEMLPPVQKTSYPSALPERWEGIKKNVLIPWFSGLLYDDMDESDLNRLFTQWDLLDYQGEY